MLNKLEQMMMTTNEELSETGQMPIKWRVQQKKCMNGTVKRQDRPARRRQKSSEALKEEKSHKHVIPKIIAP